MIKNTKKGIKVRVMHLKTRRIEYGYARLASIAVLDDNGEYFSKGQPYDGDLLERYAVEVIL